MTKKFNSVLIIGMGLIGSSISRALIENHVANNVYGLDSDSKVIKKQLQSIQQDLFNIGGEASMPKEEISLLKDDRITYLESYITKMNKELPPLEEFILPGGNELCSRLHIVRAVCRRAERSCIPLLSKKANNKNWLKYLNRLSDFIFVLIRLLNQNEGLDEMLWER